MYVHIYRCIYTYIYIYIYIHVNTHIHKYIYIYIYIHTYILARRSRPSNTVGSQKFSLAHIVSSRKLFTGEHIVRDMICCSDLC